MWSASAAPSIRERITRLAPDRRAAWGRMTPVEMVCHLVESLKLAVGDLQAASMNVPVRFPPLKQFIVYWAPFPKNAPTAPEVFARAPGEWKVELAELRVLVDRLCEPSSATLMPHGPRC